MSASHDVDGNGVVACCFLSHVFCVAFFVLCFDSTPSPYTVEYSDEISTYRRFLPRERSEVHEYPPQNFRDFKIFLEKFFKIFSKLFTELTKTGLENEHTKIAFGNYSRN